MKKYGTTGSLGVKSDLDKFYTKPEIAQHYINMLNMTEYDTIIEPSAGSGAFSSIIPDCLAFDLAPEGNHIQQADWLTLDKSQFQGRILVVGNPPFGTSGNLALQFIHAASFADTIAFVLPRGFRKDSVKNRVPLNFSLIIEEDCPKNSFTLNGEDYDVPCVFQVWQKSEKLRTPVKARTVSNILEFLPVNRKAEADFRVQRVGGRAGTAFENIDASTASNYFIKNVSTVETQKLIEYINDLEYPSVDHTTGPKSLPKGELIQCLENSLIANNEIVAEDIVITTTKGNSIALF